MSISVPQWCPGTAGAACHYIGRPYTAGLAQGHISVAAHLLGQQLSSVCHVCYGSATGQNETFRIAYRAGPNVRAVAILFVPRGYTGSGPSITVAGAETESPVTPLQSVADVADILHPGRYRFVVPVTADALQELSWTVVNTLLHSTHVYEIPRGDLMGAEDHVDRTYADASRYLTDNDSAIAPRGVPALLTAVLDARTNMRRHLVNLPFRAGIASAGSASPTFDYVIGGANIGIPVAARDVRGGATTTMPVRAKVRVSAITGGTTHTARVRLVTGGDIDITGINATGWWPGQDVAVEGEAGFCAFQDTAKLLSSRTAGGAGTVTFDSLCIYEDSPDDGVMGLARLDATVPSWLPIARGAGSWSRQTGPAVNGTTFIETGTAQNTARFSWSTAAGRLGLLIEPTRQNLVLYSNFVDVAPANGLPDGWLNGPGTLGVDNDTAAGGPHGGTVARVLATAAGQRGCYSLGAQTVGVTYAASQWIRRTTAVGAASALSMYDGAAWRAIALGAATHDWRKYVDVAAAAGVLQAAAHYWWSGGADAWSACMAQQEAGVYATSWIPTGAAAVTRAAELATVNATVKAAVATSGRMSMRVEPRFATADLAAAWTPFAWAPNWRLDYDNADSRLKVIVNGTARATSSAITLASGDLLDVCVRYGTWGQRIEVSHNGGVVEVVSDATAWGNPAGAFAPYLGSRAASANCEAAIYMDLCLEAA